MASVTPRATKTGEPAWRVQFRIDGRMRQESFSGPMASKAAHEFGDLIDRVGAKAALEVLERRRNNVAAVPTLKEWTERYLDPESGILTGIEPGTRAGYHAIAKGSFLHILGEYPVDAIERTDVGKWIEWQERQPSKRTNGKKIAAKTVRNYHALLSNILKAATETKPPLRPDNPAHKTRLTKGLAREAVFLSRDEFQRLYEQIPEYYRPLVAFLVGSQARWSEATALTWADLNTDTTPPTVRIAKAWKKNPDGAHIVGVTKSARGRHTVSLWPELVDLLGARGEPDALIFQGKLNRERIWYGSFNTRIWKPAVEASGLTRQPNIHDLRHTGASWLIADGQPLPYIQARLGHENITTTIQVYGHLLPDSHTRMSASLSGIMSNVIPTTLPLALPA